MTATTETNAACTAGSRLLFWSVAATLLLLSSLLHFWRIGSAPAGFYIDESSHGYNAYCIAQTGADEYGTRFPVFFRCFDDYHDPVMIYSLVPLVNVFGLERAVARFPSGLFLILASIAFAFLVQQYCRNKWLSALSGFVFSILPWVFVVSRIITGGYTAMLLGMVMGWWLILLALEKQSVRYATAAGAAWALAMYAHNIGRPMTALILLCFGLAYYPVLKARGKVGLVFAVSWVAVLIPMIVSVVQTPLALTSRFQKIGIFKDHPALGQIFARVASRYVDYFTLQFLFIRGDGNLRQHSGFGGELFVFLVPMLLAGLYCLVRFWKSHPGYRVVGFGLLVYPAAAVLTLDHMHSGRSINGVIFWGLTAAIGADFLWRKDAIGKALLLLACSVGIIEGTRYMKDYFGPYQVRSRVAFQAAFTRALDDSFRALGEGKTLYISDSVLGTLIPPANHDFKPFCYMDILFFGRVDPRAYLRSGIPSDRVCLYNGVIRNAGLLMRCNLRLVKAGTRGELPQFEPNSESIPAGARLLETIPVDSLMQYEVYETR